MTTENDNEVMALLECFKALSVIEDVEAFARILNYLRERRLAEATKPHRDAMRTLEIQIAKAETVTAVRQYEILEKALQQLRKRQGIDEQVAKLIDAALNEASQVPDTLKLKDFPDHAIVVDLSEYKTKKTA